LRSSERLVPRGLAWALGVIVLPGCFAPIDLSGRSCPCDPGWVCDERRDECVLEGELDAATSDAGHDAGADVGDAPSLDAPLDAGTDAGSDAPTDAPPPVELCPAEAALCDDFESDVADRVPPWSWASDDARSTVRFASGTASGLFAVPGGDTDLQDVLGFNVAADVTDVYMRFWAYVPSTATGQNLAIANVSSGTPRYENHSLIVNDAGWAIYDTVAAAYFGTEPFPEDVWTCVVYHVEMGSPGLLELSFDDARVSGMAETTFADGVSSVGLGITYLDPMDQTSPYEISIDDVAITVDGTPLVCP
jgi:hypothetical protein